VGEITKKYHTPVNALAGWWPGSEGVFITETFGKKVREAGARNFFLLPRRRVVGRLRRNVWRVGLGLDYDL